MKKLLVGFLAVIGFLSILAVIVVAAFGLLSVAAKPGVPRKVILEVDFEHGVIEALPDDAFAELMLEDTLQIRDFVDALDRAADDRRVVGLVARIGAGGIGVAHLQEIRDAVKRFRDSGKPAIAYAETFGEFGPGNGGYYLATAFDEIYMQPSGDVGLTGLIFESAFRREMYEKLGIVPRLDQRHEFKNAMNTYTEREYTDAHREGLETVMNSIFDQVLRGISESRGIDTEEVRATIDRGPFIGAEAIEAGLVDGLSYRDEVYSMLRDRSEADHFLYLDRYLERAGRPHRRGTTIALIHGYGAVMRGGSGYSPLSGAVTMGSDSVGAAFRSAIDDDRVEAILFRVDSPGGSYVASDTIWRETIRAREAGKPVIVSMGNFAGSGGYFVAMHADKIVAQPGTITASIGVLGGKLLTEGFWSKLGITFDEIHTSKNATQWSPLLDYGPEQYSRFQASLDRVYEDFTEKVADGRGLPLERVLEVARGRIWTGEDALRIGLVDALGGYDVALGLVRETLDLATDAPLRIKRVPARRSPLELLLGQRPDRSQQVLMRGLARSLRDGQPRVRSLERLFLGVEQGVVSMPETPTLH